MKVESRKWKVARDGLSRRGFVKAGATAGLALAAGRWARRAAAQSDQPDPGGRVRIDYDETLSFNELYDNPPMLGRVEGWTLRVVEEPDIFSEVVRYIHYDEVVPIYGAVHAEGPHPYQHNDVWYKLDEGYVHSSYVVPVREVFNEPEAVIGDGFWGELTALRSLRYYDLAYGTVYWVLDREDEPDGRAWYRILDDLNPRTQWWVQASHVRRIQKEEFTPISPDVPPEEKRIEISIGGQCLACFEGDVPVFETRIASGTAFVDDAGQVHYFHTPYGEHWAQRKMPSRHMVGGDTINDSFDLPGVPWCTFFTRNGAAIHGTYWHNDYGRPRSHGCINVTSDAAKWIYRWSAPHAPYEEQYYWTEGGERESATPIIVVH